MIDRSKLARWLPLRSRAEAATPNTHKSTSEVDNFKKLLGELIKDLKAINSHSGKSLDRSFSAEINNLIGRTSISDAQKPKLEICKSLIVGTAYGNYSQLSIENIQEMRDALTLLFGLQQYQPGTKQYHPLLVATFNKFGLVEKPAVISDTANSASSSAIWDDGNKDMHLPVAQLVEKKSKINGAKESRGLGSLFASKSNNRHVKFLKELVAGLSAVAKANPTSENLANRLGKEIENLIGNTSMGEQAREDINQLKSLMTGAIFGNFSQVNKGTMTSMKDAANKLRSLYEYKVDSQEFYALTKVILDNQSKLEEAIRSRSSRLINSLASGMAKAPVWRM